MAEGAVCGVCLACAWKSPSSLSRCSISVSNGDGIANTDKPCSRRQHTKMHLVINHPRDSRGTHIYTRLRNRAEKRRSETDVLLIFILINIVSL